MDLSDCIDVVLTPSLSAVEVHLLAFAELIVAHHGLLGSIWYTAFHLLAPSCMIQALGGLARSP
jgi:hypothetical protein